MIQKLNDNDIFSYTTQYFLSFDFQNYVITHMQKSTVPYF